MTGDLTPEALAEWRIDADEAHYYGGNEQVQAERIHALIAEVERLQRQSDDWMNEHDKERERVIRLREERVELRAQLATAKADAWAEVLALSEEIITIHGLRHDVIQTSAVRTMAEEVRRDAE